jgi:hypothetical protein
MGRRIVQAQNLGTAVAIRGRIQKGELRMVGTKYFPVMVLLLSTAPVSTAAATQNKTLANLQAAQRREQCAREVPGSRQAGRS